MNSTRRLLKETPTGVTWRAPRATRDKLRGLLQQLFRVDLSESSLYAARIAEHVSPAPASELDFSEAPAWSRLELTVLEAEAYRVGLSYTSGGLSYTSDQFYPDHAVYDVRDGSSKQETDPPLRYTLPAPASGQLTLRCVASIYDVWARGAEPAALREDKPRPASVTGDDSAGTRVAPQAAALLAGALLLLL
ncbi:hypothetical protein JYU34_020039 [Plutella xylostella]|uniref:Uncharacterized protein n=1 Tax=Plutella xylostella TaxID=51655 RepID=A0ABQ7PVT8_PLUXY|nr:hypothetical protein JYU34_020039 [Plutella xylostella]